MTRDTSIISRGEGSPRSLLSRILADPFWAYMADYVSSRGRVSVAEYLGPDFRLWQ